MEDDVAERKRLHDLAHERAADAHHCAGGGIADARWHHRPREEAANEATGDLRSGVGAELDEVHLATQKDGQGHRRVVLSARDVPTEVHNAHQHGANRDAGESLALSHGRSYGEAQDGRADGLHRALLHQLARVLLRWHGSIDGVKAGREMGDGTALGAGPRGAGNSRRSNEPNGWLWPNGG